MESEGDKLVSDSKEKIFMIYAEFMTRVAKLDELASVGSRFLVGFQQGLEFLRRPSIIKTSKLVERIIKANETQRVLSYVEAGCVNTHDSVKNISKYEVQTCQLGLLDQLREAKCILSQLKCLVEDATVAVGSETESSGYLLDKDNEDEFDPQANRCDKEEITSTDIQGPEATEYAVMMGVIYTMVKQDCTMQEKIVSSLSLKTSSGELESYCLMWSLRPFIDDDIMRQAWRLIP